MENEFTFNPEGMDDAIHCAKKAQANNINESQIDDLFNQLSKIKDLTFSKILITKGESLKEELLQIENLPINLELINEYAKSGELSFSLGNNYGYNRKMGMLYDQTKYDHIKYGSGTLSSDGCGFFSLLSSITSVTGYYFDDTEIEQLANIANEPIGLSNEQRMEYLADKLGDRFGFTYTKGPVNEVTQELKDGNVIIAYTPNSTSNSGHFVAITDLLESGNVVVNDSDGWAYKSDQKFRDCIDNTGFVIGSSLLHITPKGVDTNGDGKDDDVWILDFGSKKNSYNNVASNLFNFSLKNNNSINNVPNYFQTDYSNSYYGNYKISTNGCGIVSLAMVASFYLGKDIDIPSLASEYARFSGPEGSSWNLFGESAKNLNLPLEKEVYYSNEESLKEVVESLERGCVVIANAKSNSIFTDGGHFIVLTGITEDGKITVNDPNKYNYKEYNEWADDRLTNGFQNGFSQEEFKYGKVNKFWIYSPKENNLQQSNDKTVNLSFAGKFDSDAFVENLFKSNEYVDEIKKNNEKELSEKIEDINNMSSSSTNSSSTNSSSTNSSDTNSSSTNSSSTNSSDTNSSSTNSSSTNSSSTNSSSTNSSDTNSSSINSSSTNSSSTNSSSTNSSSTNSSSTNSSSTNSSSTNSSSTNSSSTNSSDIGLNIFPENKFSNVIPNLNSGKLLDMEISNSSVSYNILNMDESVYNNYINKLSESGYVLNENGLWCKENYELQLIFDKNKNTLFMSLNLIDKNN